MVSKILAELSKSMRFQIIYQDGGIFFKFEGVNLNKKLLYFVEELGCSQANRNSPKIYLCSEEAEDLAN